VKVKMDMQLKAHIASLFLDDGDDHFEIFWLGWVSERNNVVDWRSSQIALPYRGKMFVTLRMAIECYLKALVLIYSDADESPEDAYKFAVGRSHNLMELWTTVQGRTPHETRPFEEDIDKLIPQLDAMPVDFRYQSDLTVALAGLTEKQQMNEEGPIWETIGTDSWMLPLWQHTQSVRQTAYQAFREKFGRLPLIRGDDTETFMARRDRFLNQVDKKGLRARFKQGQGIDDS
jgi:hypothetical protein